MDNTTDVLRRMDYRSFYSRHIPGFEANGKTEVECLCVFHHEKTPSLKLTWNGVVFIASGVVRKEA